MSTKKYNTVPHIIAYFEILDYENIVRKYPASNFLGIINKMLTNKFWMAQNDLYSSMKPKFYCFAYDFIICYKCNKKMNAVDSSQLEWIIAVMQRLQKLLSVKEIFIKGIITIGDLYTGKNFIYGQGIIDAHTIIKKIGANPNIIIDKKLELSANNISFVNNKINENFDIGYDANSITLNNSIINRDFQQDINFMPIKRYKTFPHFIAYFDILGYSDIVRERPDFKLANIIDRILASKFRMIKKDLDSSIRPKLYCFSDNFVICYRQKNKMDAVDYIQLGQIIVIIQQLQIQLAIKGVFIRGGIKVGDLYTGKNFIYGQGIIDVAEMEKDAFYQRVVIDEKLVESIINQTVFMANELRESVSALGYDPNHITEKNVIGLQFLLWAIIGFIERYTPSNLEENRQMLWQGATVYKDIFRNCILQDEDNKYFINYMEFMISSHCLKIQTFERADELIVRLYENIEKEIKSNQNKNGVLIKYNRLLKYLHSWFINSDINNASQYAEMANELQKLT